MADEKKNKAEVLQYLGTTAMGFMVAYFGFAGTKDTNTTEVLKIEKEANRALRAELKVSNETLFLKNSEIVRLLALVNSKVSDTEVLQYFLDALPFPAWIKIKDEGDNGMFRMLMINSAYEDYYNIRKDRYVGNTDFDIHPYDIASRFSANDQVVFESKDYVNVEENVVVGEQAVPLIVWKFSIKMADGKYGVAGFSWAKADIEGCDC